MKSSCQYLQSKIIKVKDLALHIYLSIYIFLISRLEAAGRARRVPSSGRALAGCGHNLRAEQTGGTGRAAKTM